MARKQDLAYNSILGMIASGQYRYGQRLPNELELSEQLQVSRVTLRAALKRLIAERVIVRSKTRIGGTLVSQGSAAKPKVLLVNSLPIEHNVSNPLNYILPGIEKRCHELGWEYDMITTDFLAESKLNQLGVIGIILTLQNLTYTVPWLKYLQNCGLPVVQVHGFHHDPVVSHFATILNDYAEAWQNGLKYLLKLGHRKIAFLNHGGNEGYHRFKLSEKSMLELMAKFGAQVDWNPFFHPFPDQFDQVAKVLVTMPEPPTALFCYSDYFAMKMYEALAPYKIKFPEDMAILGLGGISGVNYLVPKLSTIDLGYDFQGQIAVDLLARYEEWKNLSPPPIIYVPSHIVAEASTEKFIFNFKGGQA